MTVFHLTQLIRPLMTNELKIPFENFPGYHLRMASNSAMTKLTSLLAEFNIKVVEITVLGLVSANPECKQNQIGKTLNIASANMTPLITRLENRGLISRKPLDGRTNALTLTPEGQNLFDTVLPQMQLFEENLVSGLTDEEKTQLTLYLKNIPKHI